MLHHILVILGVVSLCAIGTDALTAMAKFNRANSGARGYVTVNDNNAFAVAMDFSKVNTSLLPTNSCFTNGIQYHIHTKWAYGDQNDRIGESACGAEFLGGHYDPWLACGNSTANTDCSVLGGCVLASTSWDPNANKYVCNSSIYLENPYSCEVGDLSGKYGLLHLRRNAVLETHQSFWEISASDLLPGNGLYNASIVFHCSTGERAICAPFTFSKMKIPSIPCSSKELAYADFSDIGSSYQGLNISFSESKWNFEVPSAITSQCNSWYLYLHEKWNSSTMDASNNCTNNLIGNIWDPTSSCINGSSSPYCNNGVRCTNNSISYNCSSYSCAVGDISGRIGAIDFSNLKLQQGYYSFSLNEEIPVALSLVNGKSLRLKCMNSTMAVSDVCAEIYYANTTTTTKKHKHSKKMKKVKDIF